MGAAGRTGSEEEDRGKCGPWSMSRSMTGQHPLALLAKLHFPKELVIPFHHFRTWVCAFSWLSLEDCSCAVAAKSHRATCAAKVIWGLFTFPSVCVKTFISSQDIKSRRCPYGILWELAPGRTWFSFGQGRVKPFCLLRQRWRHLWARSLFSLAGFPYGSRIATSCECVFFFLGCYPKVWIDSKFMVGDME